MIRAIVVILLISLLAIGAVFTLNQLFPPEQKAGQTVAKTVQIPIKPDQYIVREGETYASIAAVKGISEASLRDHNLDRTIAKGSIIEIPATGEVRTVAPSNNDIVPVQRELAAIEIDEEYSGDLLFTIQTTKPGVTIHEIAFYYDIIDPTTQIVEQNVFLPDEIDNIPAGKRIVIARNPTP